TLTRFGRNEHDRRKRKELKFLPDLTRIVGRNTMGFLDGIPFVDSNDDGPAGLMSITSDMGVEGGNAFHTVDNQNGNVAALQTPPRLTNTHLFRFQFCLSFSSDTGGVNNPHG